MASKQFVHIGIHAAPHTTANAETERNYCRPPTHTSNNEIHLTPQSRSPSYDAQRVNTLPRAPLRYQQTHHPPPCLHTASHVHTQPSNSASTNNASGHMKKGHLRALPTHTCAVQQNRRTRQQRQIQRQPRACQCNKYKTFRMLPNTALRCNALRRKHITQLERRPNLKCRPSS